MEQRAPRLGDIVDDYCPRERRITNHAIVAVVEDAIRQTRCTTCDAEHVYKEGREPVRRKKPAPTVSEGRLAPPVDADGVTSTVVTLEQVAVSVRVESAHETADVRVSAGDGGARPDPEPAVPDDGWLAHRRLIRASLPRVDGEPPEPRPIPEFTMYQRPAGRGARFGQGRGGGNGNGGFGGRGDFRHGQNGNGEPNGNRANDRGNGRPGRRRHGKRSR